MSENNPVTLNETLQTFFESAMSVINTCMPGRIESFNEKESSAVVQPLISRKFRDGSSQDFPALADVPVIFPRTQSGGIVFPLQRNDGCLILFSQRALERWKSSSGELVEPGDPRKFDLTDAVCIPGLFPLSASTIQENSSDLLIKNGNATITLKQSGDIEIKGNADLKKLVNEEFQDLFNNHGHEYTSPGGPVASSTPVTGIPPVVILPPTPITDNELTSDTRAS